MQLLAKIACAIWAVTIFVLSLMPGDKAPDTGFSDKLEHGAAYFLLGLLLCLGWRRPSLSILSAILYGLAIELAQGASGHRTFDLLDAAANSAGAFIGISAYIIGISVKKSPWLNRA